MARQARACAVLSVRTAGGVEQGGDLGAGEQLGQALRGASHGNLQASLGLAEHLAHEEANRAGRLVDAGARELALLQQEQQVGLHLFVAESIGAAVVMPSQGRDVVEVGF